MDRLHTVLGILVAVALSTTPCFSAQTLAVGEAAIPFTLADGAGVEHSLAEQAGKPVVLLFWGSNNAAMREHSKELLDACEVLLQEYAEHELQIISILALLHDPSDQALPAFTDHVSFPILLDREGDVYAAYGLILLPEVVLLDQGGEVRDVIGYTPKAISKLRGSLDVMLGLRTAAQVDAERHPSRTVVLDEQKKALRHLALGRRFLEKERHDKALEEIMAALAADSLCVEALVVQAQILLDLDQAGEALRALEKALAAKPELREARFLEACALRTLGRVDEAVEILVAFEGRDELKARALTLLGRHYRETGALEEATEAFDQALLILLKNR